MSTRAQIRFATREDGVSFNEHPEKLITKYGSQLDESYYKLNTNDDG